MMDTVNAFALAWWSWMGPMLWQASLLILIVSVIDLLIGRWAWPQVRYALWLLVLVKLLIPPAWSLPTSIISQVQPWARAQLVRLIADDSARSFSPERLQPRRRVVPQSSAVPSSAAQSDSAWPSSAAGAASEGGRVAAAPVWQVWAMGVWLLGMALFAGLLAARMIRLRRWHREHDERRTVPVWFHELLVRTAQRLQLERLPAIVFSDEAVTPAVYGTFRPVLLLPADYTESVSREDAEHVLLHELAHLKRGDLWLHGLLLVLQIVYWFNPLLIWVRKQTKHVREICCDLTIANVLREKTRQYRQTLLDTARRLLTESLEPGMGLLGVFEEPFRLVTRLRWLEGESWRSRRLATVASVAVVLLMVPLLLPMGAIAAGGADEAAETRTGASGAAGSGDVYIREQVHGERWFLFVRYDTALRYESEAWINDRRMTIIEPRQTRIVDLDAGVFRVLNPRDETYVELPLPVDPSTALDDELQRLRRHNQTSITVEDTGDIRDILGLRCRKYELTTWDIRDGVRANYRQAKVWAAAEVDFDMTVFYELMRSTRRLWPWDAAARRELEKIVGLQMGFDTYQKDFPYGERIRTEVVEIARREPPPGIYEVPPGYRRKERLTREDL